MRDVFFVVSIAQVFDILEHDNSIFIINFCNQSLKLMTSFKPNTDFVLKEILHLLGSHAKYKYTNIINQYHQLTTQMQSEQLLTNIFMLCLENDHLRLQINNQKSQSNKDEEYVLKRIELIEASMGKQLKHKEQKIGQLNQHIREIHGLNENISTQLDNLRVNYKNLQQVYIKEVSEYKDKLTQQKNNYFKSLQAIKSPHDKCCDHEYTLRVLQRQKEQLSSQIERLTKVTIKQLQTDLQILMKQNQSYMLSINNYRAEQNSFKNEKSKYEEEIKKYSEQANQNAMLSFQWQKNVSEIKIQTEKLRAKCQELEKQNQVGLEKVTKINSETVAQLKQVISNKQTEALKLKEAVKVYAEEIQKKSRKLKEYDDQYALYVTKMNNLMHELHSVKGENSKIKQKSEQLIMEERVKNKEKIDKLMSTHNAQMNRIKSEYEEKVNGLMIKTTEDKFEQIQQLEQQTAQVKQQFENLLRQHETKFKKTQQQRDNAIKQWEELLAEMGKQKIIISSLQKQIDCYRKSNQNYVMGYSTANNDVMKKSIQISAISSQIHTERTPFSTNRDTVREKTERDSKHIQEKLKSEYSQQDEIEQQGYLRRIQKLKEESVALLKQSSFGNSQANQFCNACDYGRNSFDSTKREKPEKSEYSNIPRSRSITSTRQRYATTTATSKQSHLQTPYNRLSTNRKQLNPQLNSQNDRPPLSSKRKDGNFKKYEYLRTKTQENIQSNYEYIPKSKQVMFFDQPQRENQKITTNYNSQQNYQSLRTQPSEQSVKNVPEKLMRSSSLQKVNYDKNLDEIQQYLSFNLNSVKNMGRSASDHKLKEPRQAEPDTYKSRGTLYDSIPQRNLLVQKMNNIASAREQQEIAKQSKFYNFCKRPQPQTLSRGAKAQKNIEKENINEIIHRKCQYISQT